MNIIEKLKTLESVYCVLTGKIHAVKDIMFFEGAFKGDKEVGIVLDNNTNSLLTFTPSGVLTHFLVYGECLLFPSKENRDWDSINMFKDGDPVMVKMDSMYHLRYHTGLYDKTNHFCYVNQQKSGKTSLWEEVISLETFLKM